MGRKCKKKSLQLLDTSSTKVINLFVVNKGGSGWGGGSDIHYSYKKLPIIHLIKIFAYSLNSIPVFIKNLIFLCLINKSYIPHCLFPTLVPRLWPLGWLFTHWLTNSLNEKKHNMAFNGIILCPITSLNINVLFYDKLQEMPFCFPCACI